MLTFWNYHGATAPLRPCAHSVTNMVVDSLVLTYTTWSRPKVVNYMWVTNKIASLKDFNVHITSWLTITLIYWDALKEMSIQITKWWRSSSFFGSGSLIRWHAILLSGHWSTVLCTGALKWMILPQHPECVFINKTQYYCDVWAEFDRFRLRQLRFRCNTIRKLQSTATGDGHGSFSPP